MQSKTSKAGEKSILNKMLEIILQRNGALLQQEPKEERNPER